MTKISKRHFNNKNLIDPERKYDLQEAIAILKDATNAKFEESIDVAINLGIDGKQSEQNVRGSALLPNGSGKNLKVIVHYLILHLRQHGEKITKNFIKKG